MASLNPDFAAGRTEEKSAIHLGASVRALKSQPGRALLVLEDLDTGATYEVEAMPQALALEYAARITALELPEESPSHYPPEAEDGELFFDDEEGVGHA